MNERKILVQMRHCTVRRADNNAYVESHIFPLQLDPIEDHRKNSPRMLSWPQIFQRCRDVTAEEENLAAQIAGVQSQPPSGSPAADARHREHLNHLESKRVAERQKLRGLHAEIHLRPALACGCLCFVLVGCPVGIWFSRSDYLSAFITCFLPIVFIYYPLMLCGTNLAKEGKFHPAPALWAANALMGVLALVLFRRLLKN
jgi:lipopolysaccharide export system permease protein